MYGMRFATSQTFRPCVGATSRAGDKRKGKNRKGRGSFRLCRVAKRTQHPFCAPPKDACLPTGPDIRSIDNMGMGMSHLLVRLALRRPPTRADRRRRRKDPTPQAPRCCVPMFMTPPCHGLALAANPRKSDYYFSLVANNFLCFLFVPGTSHSHSHCDDVRLSPSAIVPQPMNHGSHRPWRRVGESSLHRSAITHRCEPGVSRSSGRSFRRRLRRELSVD